MGEGVEFLNWTKYLFYFLSVKFLLFFLCLKQNIYFNFFEKNRYKFGSQIRLSIDLEVKDTKQYFTN